MYSLFYIVLLFENDVKTYGTETQLLIVLDGVKFENDVKTYGTETYSLRRSFPVRLRMM